jgi:hypothetical protein
MAKYVQGINGIFIGKVGQVVGCVLNGNPYMRGKPSPRTGKVGAVEQGNRNKFATVQAWLKPLLPLLRSGYANNPAKPAAYNAAKSHNLKYAISAGEIEPALIKVSMGDLQISEGLTVTYLEKEKLVFQWDPAYLEGTNAKDQIMVLAYHPESKTAIYELHGSFRDIGIQELKVYKDFFGKTIHVYAAFIAADRDRQSDSVYLGAIDC